MQRHAVLNRPQHLPPIIRLEVDRGTCHRFPAVKHHLEKRHILIGKPVAAAFRRHVENMVRVGHCIEVSLPHHQLGHRTGQLGQAFGADLCRSDAVNRIGAVIIRIQLIAAAAQRKRLKTIGGKTVQKRLGQPEQLIGRQDIPLDIENPIAFPAQPVA